jgi:transcription antitermination factor NusG
VANAVYNWYVFYTCPNAEKVVCNELLKRKYDVFLPLVKTLRYWKNRQKKMVSKVLFRGYILVRTTEPEIFNIVQISRIVYCVKSGGRPGIVPDKDVECIKRMLASGNEISTEHNFTNGEHVKVVWGPLTGCEGILLKRRGKNRFGILLKDINQCACIEIHTNMLAKA